MQKQQKVSKHQLNWQHHESSTSLSGGDEHISAEFLCAISDSTIRGSFFFDALLCPQALSVGDLVQLVNVQMQEWNGSAQLSGKNVQIFHMPELPDCICKP